MFTATVRVQTFELDSFGHVNNSVYLNYLEAARAEYLLQMGVSFLDFERARCQLVIVESYVKYRIAARYGDDIRVDGTVTEAKGPSVRIEYDLRRVSDNAQLATAWTKGAFISVDSGRPIRPPEPFASAFYRAASASPAQ